MCDLFNVVHIIHFNWSTSSEGNYPLN